MKLPHLCLAFVLLAGGVAHAAEPDVIVRSSLDRTAIWVADRVIYTIELTCKRGVDVLAEDLSRDKLKTEGLEVIDSSTDRRTASDGSTVHRFHYLLTTYRIDVPALTIAPLKARYAVRRAGQRLEDAVPAGDVQVPGVAIAFRSVLPDDQDPAGIRSDKPHPARPLRFALLQSIGIGLVIVSIVPGVLAIAATVRRIRRPRVRRSARAVRHEERASLEAVRLRNVDSVEERREVFNALDVLVRAHLHEVCGVAGQSLTPPEVPPAVAAAGADLRGDLVASILEACERARYAPPHALPSADACRDAIAGAEAIIGA